MNSNLSHPIPPGTVVLIHHVVLACRPFAEGKALVLAAAADEPGLYQVRFEGECHPCWRHILSGPYQTQPDACITALHEHWLNHLKLGFEFPVFPRADRRRG